MTEALISLELNLKLYKVVDLNIEKKDVLKKALESADYEGALFKVMEETIVEKGFENL